MHKTATLILGFLLGSFCLFAQDLYDIDHVSIIELTFDVPNWDQAMDANYANNLDERLLASCIINGIPFDSVGVKYKGNSTYDENNAKNPLNIKLDYNIGSQNYDGWYTLKLSNGDKDPSFVREALSYEILRKYMIAPLSNFAKVYINDSYYGLFTSNESINKKFIEDYFYSDRDNTLIKGNPEVVLNGGSSLEYLGIDSTLYYEFYEMKSDYGWSELASFIDELENDFSNAESFLDIDRAIWMLAFNNVFVNLDSYSGPFKQNYYLYKDNHDRMNSIVWDLNMSFGGFRLINFGGPSGPITARDLQEMNPLLRFGDAGFPLIDNILSDERYRKMYIAHCRTMLEENFANGLYFERAETMQSLIYDDYDNDPGQFFSTSNFSSNITSTVSVGGGPGNGPYIGLSELMEGRSAYLLEHEEFQKEPPTISPMSTAIAIPNTIFDISVEVSNSNYVYLAYRNSKTDLFKKVEMFDDGAHNDGISGDGIYGANLEVASSNVQYYFYAENENAAMFSPQRAEHEFYDLMVAQEVVINEFMASNDTTAFDQNGEYDDWIELFNRTSENINLEGFYLSDDVGDLSQWAFPAGTVINANDYIVVWADSDEDQDGLHANFKLSASGEALYLSDGSSNVLDEVVFPSQTTDLSYGRYPNGTGDFTFMSSTFNAENLLDPLTTTKDQEKFESIIVYPNPIKDYFVVDLGSELEESLVVYNSIGQTMYQGLFSNGTSINTSSWPNGMYFAMFDDRNIIKIVKL